MIGESTNSKKLQLALAVAKGTSIADWARDNQVPERTAYNWARLDRFRAKVDSIRRRILDQAIGRLAMQTVDAADEIAELRKHASSESVKLSANRAVFSDYIGLSKYSGLEGRIAKLEERSRERADNAS